ncbi:hypothetical protein BBX50_19750 [Ensifer sp. LC11]|nr:hypothetical protein BBX50_19750 [Ensifer sp. LC11]
MTDGHEGENSVFVWLRRVFQNAEISPNASKYTRACGWAICVGDRLRRSIYVDEVIILVSTGKGILFQAADIERGVVPQLHALPILYGDTALIYMKQTLQFFL